MRLVCVAQQLTGEYGTVIAGQEFECRDETGKQLVLSRLARKPGSPRIAYETKPASFEAPEVSPRMKRMRVKDYQNEKAPD